MKHKWHDEIVAWAGGAEIEFYHSSYAQWVDAPDNPDWSGDIKFRIKPQPKQPKYLYVIMYDGNLNSVRLSQYLRLGENEFIFGKIEVQND